MPAPISEEEIIRRVEQRCYEVPSSLDTPCLEVPVGDGIDYGSKSHPTLGPRYRAVYYGGRHWKLHRLMYFWFSGDEEFDVEDTSVHVLHKCHNHHCIRPEHLELGDHTLNMRQMFETRRDYQRKRRKHSNIKDIVRKLFIEGVSQAAIREQYPQLTNGSISKIWRRKSYKEYLPVWEKPTFEEFRYV